MERITHNSLKTYKGYLACVKNRIELIEERFSLAEIKESLYNKQLAKFQQEREEIEKQIEKIKAGLVPKKDIKEVSDKIMTNLPGIWLSGKLRTKKLIQTLIFPEGISYDKTMDKLFVKRLTPGFYLP